MKQRRQRFRFPRKCRLRIYKKRRCKNIRILLGQHCVQGCVTFQLPKYRFVEESEEFMRIVGGGEGDGPIELDVALGDFESFLKAFLPRASAMYDDRPALTAEEWTSVLKLSTQWLFNDLRKLAISHLSSTKMDAIDRICLAKEYRVYDWLLEGYEQIVHRLLTFDAACGPQTILTTQEGKRIGGGCFRAQWDSYSKDEVGRTRRLIEGCDG
ncbi:hypothetical protein BKA70DRAFT_1150737 [Coprinopsis sp. MPI-PUGE-AT-0042]|nr:hypothetical protein BKA70DRAFT_1150737 [Coprinopsis sp. MPI-PUGE-AT-0042]